MLTCPLCQENWVVTTTLCEECALARRLMALYSRDEVLDILKRVLLREHTGISNRTETESTAYQKARTLKKEAEGKTS